MTALAGVEAVPLAYALVSRIAEANGVRALAIKGVAATAQGLRSSGGSTDVDILTAPADLSAFQAALEAAGWHDQGPYDTPSIMLRHSVTHRHPLWPCEVDLHHWFPGFLAPPGDVFDLLWARRTTVQVAEAEMTVPDVVSHTAICALHYLRDHHGREKLPGLVERTKTSLTSYELQELSDLAGRAGAADTLAPFLEAVDAPPAVGDAALAFSYDDWRFNAGLETTAVTPWLVQLRRTPWRARPAYLWRAVWLDEDELRRWQPDLGTSRTTLARARLARLRRGLRALPGARSAMRRRSDS